MVRRSQQQKIQRIQRDMAIYHQKIMQQAKRESQRQHKEHILLHAGVAAPVDSEKTVAEKAQCESQANQAALYGFVENEVVNECILSEIFLIV